MRCHTVRASLFWSFSQSERASIQHLVIPRKGACSLAFFPSGLPNHPAFEFSADHKKFSGVLQAAAQLFPPGSTESQTAMQIVHKLGKSHYKDWKPNDLCVRSVSEKPCVFSRESYAARAQDSPRLVSRWRRPGRVRALHCRDDLAARALRRDARQCLRPAC